MMFPSAPYPGQSVVWLQPPTFPPIIKQEWLHERRCLDVKPAEKYPSHFSFPIRYCFSSCSLMLPLSWSPSPLPSFLSRIPEPWAKTYLSYFKWIFEVAIASCLQKGDYYPFYIIFPFLWLQAIQARVRHLHHAICRALATVLKGLFHPKWWSYGRGGCVVHGSWILSQSHSSLITSNCPQQPQGLLQL